MNLTKRITPEEYFAIEEKSNIRHEYLDGYLYEMSGASSRHSVICTNLVALIRPRLRAGHCCVYSQDMRAQVEATNSYYYPDVMVACGSVGADDYAIKNPVLLVEVISPGTVSIDRREKLFAYQQIESLKEYVIVHQKHRWIELHRRNSQGDRERFDIVHGGELIIEAVQNCPIRLTLDEIYEDTGLSDTPVVRETVESYLTGKLQEYSDQEIEEYEALFH